MGEDSRRPEEVRLAVTSKGHGVFKGACGGVMILFHGREDSSISMAIAKMIDNMFQSSNLAE